MIYLTVPGVYHSETWNEPVEVLAPDVTLDNCRINGTHREDILLTMYHNTKLINSVLLGSANGAHRGIRADAIGCRIHRSRVLNIFSDIHTQALAAWEGCYDLICEDSELQASGENILFGGSYCSSEKLIPQKIRILNCDLSKPDLWLNDPAVTCVNNFEIKFAIDLKLKNCKMYGSRAGGGQDGYAIVITVRHEPPPYGKIENVEISGCEIINTTGGVHFLGHDDTYPELPNGLEDVVIANNRFRDMYGNARQFMLNSGSRNLQIINNEVYGLDLNSIITFTNQNYKNEEFQFVGNNVPEGKYGIIGDGLQGKTALEFFAPGYIWENNTIRDKSGWVEYP